MNVLNDPLLEAEIEAYFDSLPIETLEALRLKLLGGV